MRAAPGGRPVRRTLAAALGLAAVGAAAVALADDPGDPAGPLGGEESARTARFDRWVPLRSARLARTEVAAARVGNFIYVVGGFVRSGNATTAAVERYDIRRNRWARVRDMPVGLNHPAAVAHGGRLYVLGGYTADASLAGETNAFLRYDPARNRWSRMPPMPTRRAALAAGVIGDRIYAAGGATSGGTTFRRLEVFDLRTRRWARGPDMAVAREHVAGAVSGRAFYVLGGRPGDLAVAERYVPARRRWQRLRDLRTPRSGIAAATVGRLVVVFGGETGRGTTRGPDAGAPCRGCARRATASAAPPWVAACTRWRAGRSPASPSPARSRSWTCAAARLAR